MALVPSHPKIGRLTQVVQMQNLMARFALHEAAHAAQAPYLGRMRFSNSQHGSAARPPIMPAMRLGSDTLKTEFHNSPANQLAANIAAMVSSRRCQIGNIGCIASFTLLVHLAVSGDRRSRGFIERPSASNDPFSGKCSRSAVATMIRSHAARCTWP